MPTITTPTVNPGDTALAAWAQAVKADLEALAREAADNMFLALAGN